MKSLEKSLTFNVNDFSNNFIFRPIFPQRTKQRTDAIQYNDFFRAFVFFCFSIIATSFLVNKGE